MGGRGIYVCDVVCIHMRVVVCCAMHMALSLMIDTCFHLDTHLFSPRHTFVFT